MAMNPPKRRFEFHFDRLTPANIGPLGGDQISTVESACGTCKRPYTDAIIESSIPLQSGVVGRRLRIKCGFCGNRLWWLWGPGAPTWMTRQFRQQHSGYPQEMQFTLRTPQDQE